jgi:hypothetical protein
MVYSVQAKAIAVVITILHTKVISANVMILFVVFTLNDFND